MVPRPHRFGRVADFTRVLSRGQRLQVGPLRLQWAQNGLPQSRFAIVVSLRVEKRAVIRNRLRRRIYEQIRRDLPFLIPGCDCVIRLNPPAATMPRKDLAKAVDILLRRSGILRKPLGPVAK